MGRSFFPLSDADLLHRIERSPGGKAGYKQLIRELGLGGGRERRLLLEQLGQLVKQGLLLQEDGLWSARSRRATTDQSTPPEMNSSQMSREATNSRLVRPGLLSGRLELHREGYGFVRAPQGTRTASDPRSGSDIFIPPNALHGAMHGDLVLVDEDPTSRDGRRAGKIARVLTRRNQTLVGIFHHASRATRSPRQSEGHGTAHILGNYVQPWDDRLGGPILIPPGAERVPVSPAAAHRTLGEGARRSWMRDINQGEGADGEVFDFAIDGLAVEVEITRFPQPGRPAMGRVLEILGHPDDFGVDVEIVIRKHALPHTFPAHVLAEAEQSALVSESSSWQPLLDQREDFREFPVVTIDGETARDFDDAVFVRDLGDGHTELQVHIADVSHYVRSGSAVDVEARVRGTSVYFPDRAIPMLPHVLSSGLCSLLPGEDRTVLSCIMRIDADGELVSFRLAEGLIRSARRFTYTTVQRCLNASPRAAEWNAVSSVTPDSAAEDTAERERVGLEQPELPAAVDRMLDLALRLNRKRMRRGSIDFDLPEPVVEFDPDGNMKAIVRSERGWAHRLIEEFMLSANECVATWLTAQAIPSLYRIHEMPDAKRIVDFEETAAAFGETLGLGALPMRRLNTKGDRREAQRRSARGIRRQPTQVHELPDRISVTPQMYQRLVRRVAGKPEERILSYLMLRSLKQARYSVENEGHFALASPCYTHFTSPIRRYPDLIVHRLLRAMLQAGADPQGGPVLSRDPQPWEEEKNGAQRRHSLRTRELVAQPIPAVELADIAAESSQAERRAADAERELVDWKKMKFMADKIGDDFTGIILSVTKFGFFVELDELFIEGLVPLSSLTGDFFSFRDTDRVIRGTRTDQCFRVGDRVAVFLDRIDHQQRRLQFGLLQAAVAAHGGDGRNRASTKKASKPKQKRSSQEKTRAAKRRKRL